MKYFSGKILLVVGTYSNKGGKSSFFGKEIFAVFNEYFGSENVKYFNGGISKWTQPNCDYYTMPSYYWKKRGVKRLWWRFGTKKMAFKF